MEFTLMDIRIEIEKIINEESMPQKTARVERLKAKIISLKTAGRQGCDEKPPELRGLCYQQIGNSVKKAEIALSHIGR
jgi:hypothetical protein